MQVGLDVVASANCKSRHLVRSDELPSTFVHNFNNIFSVSGGYRQTEY